MKSQFRLTLLSVVAVLSIGMSQPTFAFGYRLIVGGGDMLIKHGVGSPLSYFAPDRMVRCIANNRLHPKRRYAPVWKPQRMAPSVSGERTQYSSEGRACFPSWWLEVCSGSSFAILCCFPGGSVQPGGPSDLRLMSRSVRHTLRQVDPACNAHAITRRFAFGDRVSW